MDRKEALITHCKHRIYEIDNELILLNKTSDSNDSAKNALHEERQQLNAQLISLINS